MNQALLEEYIQTGNAVNLLSLLEANTELASKKTSQNI